MNDRALDAASGPTMHDAVGSDTPRPLGFLAGERRGSRIEWEPRLLAGEQARILRHRKLITDSAVKGQKK